MNITNLDNRCFIHAIACTNENHMSLYCHEVLSHFILDDLEFPLKIKDINNIERQNAVSTNVYGVEDESGEIYPLRIYKTYILNCNDRF